MSKLKVERVLDRQSTDHITMKMSEVTDLNGEVHKWDWVQRNVTTKAMAVVPLLYKEGESCQSAEIVLIRQFRVPVNDYVWEFPAGLMDGEDEDSFDVVSRELFEETGLSIIRTFHETPQLYNSPGLTDESISYVIAEVAGEISDENCGTLEDLTIHTFSVGDVKKLLQTDEKIDSKCYAWLNWFILQFGAETIFDWSD